MSTISPSMLLTIPDLGVTPDPVWASELNQSLYDIDSHDHSVNKGVQVTPAGLNINSDLSFNGHDAITLRATAYDNQANFLPNTDLRRIYVKGGDLFYNNASGQPVKITAGTTLNTTGIGSIGGDYGLPGVPAAVTYSNTTKTYLFTQDAGQTGSMATGPLNVFNNTIGSNSVTLKPPTGLAASYTLSFPPTLPPGGDDHILTIDANGNVSAPTTCRHDGTIEAFGAATTSLIVRLTASDFHRQNNPLIQGRNTNYIPQGSKAAIDSIAAADGTTRSQILWDTSRQSMVYYRPDAAGVLGFFSSEIVPVGAAMEYYGASAPFGWLFMNGQAISRTTYSALFAIIGTTWGAGDGTTTFNIPDRRGRVALGVGTGPASYQGDTNPTLTSRTLGQALGRETHTLVTSELSLHSHSVGSLSLDAAGGHAHTITGSSNIVGLGVAGQLTTIAGTNTNPATATTDGAGTHTHNISGSTDIEGGNSPHNNMQPALVCNFIIKY